MTRQQRSNLHYAIGLTVIATSAVGMEIARDRAWLNIIKLALPIRKPLADFDRDTLRPYEVVSVQKLSAEMEADLGTGEYLNWALREPGKRSKLDEILLHSTYYTDVQDQVPHVPEECLGQGANFIEAGSEALIFKLDRMGEDAAVRRLRFFPPNDFVKRNLVYYTICVNGQFCSDRTAARTRMSDFRDTHLYYAKVEIHMQNLTEKDEPAADETARALMDMLLTELMKSHWPPRGSERAAKE